MAGGRSYRDILTLGQVDLQEVVAAPNGVLAGRIGSTVFQRAGARITIWQNVDGGTTWIERVPHPANTITVGKGTQQSDYTTIAAALAAAVAGDVVTVLPGTYLEMNPLVVPPGVTVQGSGGRRVTWVVCMVAGAHGFVLSNASQVQDLMVFGPTDPAMAAFDAPVALAGGSATVYGCTVNGGEIGFLSEALCDFHVDGCILSGAVTTGVLVLAGAKAVVTDLVTTAGTFTTLLWATGAGSFLDVHSATLMPGAATVGLEASAGGVLLVDDVQCDRLGTAVLSIGVASSILGGGLVIRGSAGAPAGIGLRAMNTSTIHLEAVFVTACVTGVSSEDTAILQVEDGSVLGCTTATSKGALATLQWSGTTPLARLSAGESLGYDGLRNETTYTPAGSADANGSLGSLTWDVNFHYVKGAAGWVRVPRIPWTVPTESASYGVPDTEFFGLVLLNGAGAAVDATLPTAVGRNGWSIEFKAIDLTFAVRILPSGVETIDGAASFTFQQVNDCKKLWSDGANWRASKVSSGRIEMACTVDGAGALIPTGLKAYRPPATWSGTIKSWSIMSDAVGNLVWDVWKANGVLPTNLNSITAAAKPTLAAQQFASSTAVGTWTTTVAVGDIFAFEIEVNSVATWVTLILDVEVNG